MFIVLALPRSRTYWLSRFLSYRDWQCGHDELRHCRSFDDVRSWLAQPQTGTVETTAAPFWRLIPELMPDARIVTVRRPVVEVVDSLARCGLGIDPVLLHRTLKRYDRKLDQLEYRLAGVLRVDYAELATEAGCARVFEHCLPYPHDAVRWRLLAGRNLQVNLDHLLRYAQAYAPQLAKLAGTARHRVIAGMRPKETCDDGVTFQQEPFRSSFADATELMADHMVATGQAVDDFTRKNLPVLHMLDDMGALQVTTARSNGRMFGYLLSVLSPSLDDPGRVFATQSAFFASSAIRGLGMRLQRASVQALRHRGVHEVHFRAGTRGAGPRLGTFFRRLGAVPSGELYRLELEA